MRKLLVAYMEAAGSPDICRRIREERLRLKAEWTADHPGEKGNPYTQEAIARELKLSLKAYRAYEDTREPSRPRTREIARTLGLPEDHFEQGPLSEQVRAVLREELEEVHETLRRLEGLLGE